MRYSLEKRISAVRFYIESGCYSKFLLKWSNYFQSKPPSRNTIRRLVSNFQNEGSLKDRKRSGRKKLRDEDLIATVGAFFSINQDASINTFLREFDNIVSRTTVWRILKKDLMWKPFRPRRVHRLLPGDDVRRYWCFDRLLKMQQTDPTFLVKIIWSDECIFKLNGTIATNNVVYWSEENPHFTYQRTTNGGGVMVFAAISAIGLITLGFFDETQANMNSKSVILSIKPAILK